MLRLTACWISFSPVRQLSDICTCYFFVAETNGCWRSPIFYADSYGGHGTVMCTDSKYLYLEGSWISALQVNRICCLSHLVVPSLLVDLGFLIIEDSCSDTQFPTWLPMSGLGGYITVTEVQGLRWKILNPNPSRHADLTNTEITACLLPVTILGPHRRWTRGTKDSLLPDTTAWDKRGRGELSVFCELLLHIFLCIMNGLQSLHCHSLSQVETALSWISLLIRWVNNKSTNCPVLFLLSSVSLTNGYSKLQLYHIFWNFYFFLWHEFIT